MDALVLKISKEYEDIIIYVSRVGDQEQKCLGSLDRVSLKDVEWLVLANTSEHTTPFIVEVNG